VAQDAMLRESGGMFARRSNQLARPQPFQGDLDRTFGKPGSFRDHPQAGADWLPSLPFGLAVEMKINQKRGRLVVVTNQVTHQDVQDIIVDRDRLAETGHLEN
jgi:hypothetical protein